MSTCRTLLLLVVVSLLFVSSTAARAEFPATPLPGPAGEESPIALGAATHVRVAMTGEPPALTEEQKARLEARDARGPLPPETAPPVGTTAVQRPDSVPDPSTAVVPGSARPQSPSAPGDFTLFRNTSFGATIKSHTSGLTGEPTAANTGPVVFATGNWWAALSVDGGQTFSYINPATQFPASFGGFCCDQVTLYDPSRDLFIWYLQYDASGPAGAGQNLYRLAVARPSDAINGDWYYWDIVSAVNTEWDYPDMCLSNDYVWITTNRGTYNSGSVNTSWYFRWPLDDLADYGGLNGGQFNFGANGYSNLSWRCTRGARDTMYMGSHNSTSQIRILRRPENTSSLFFDDVNLSAAWFSTTSSCPTPDGRDWCGFDGHRILGAWVSRGMIGFLWDSDSGGGFAVPYVDALRVVESTRAYLNRPFIWNSTLAFAYPAAAPNARGDVGIVVHASSTTLYPSFYVGIDDDYSRDAGYGPPGWEVKFVRQGTQGPTTNRWGDYFSVQEFAPNALAWVATGTTMQGCGGSGCKETRYEIFGRQRDLRSVQRYYNRIFGSFLPFIDR